MVLYALKYYNILLRMSPKITYSNSTHVIILLFFFYKQLHIDIYSECFFFCLLCLFLNLIFKGFCFNVLALTLNKYRLIHSKPMIAYQKRYPTLQKHFVRETCSKGKKMQRNYFYEDIFTTV